jgi:two-component system, NtrC family, response regulator AtoC
VAHRLLIVDDEQNIRRILQVAFEKVGYHVSVAENAHQALEVLDSHDVDCVITDVTMPGLTGFELLREIKQRIPSVPVVIMTAYGTIPQAVQAMRDGAVEFVTKPFDLDAVKKVVALTLASNSPKRKGMRPRLSEDEDPFLAISPAMQSVLSLVRQVAESRATVMINGESGVGKEVVAKALHRLSSRSKKSFVAVSCAAIPDTLLEAELFGHEKGAFTGAQGAKAGRFELADGGTLMLDEVGEIPMSTQVKLLRVLQEREFERLGATRPTRVDVRVISATHRDLEQAVEDGMFRLDLLYRLQVIEILVPPLRERVEDVLPLAQLFLTRLASENGREALHIPEETAKLLTSYEWPGNVRELENTMERATVLAPESCLELLPGLLPKSLKHAA